MSSVSDLALPVLAVVTVIGAAVISTDMAAWQDPAPRTSALKVCADPNNMPYSNAAGDGFENALASLVANDLGLSLRYTWWPQRRGFLRNTLQAKLCDVVMGVPTTSTGLATTRPYYRSTYVVVARQDRNLRSDALDDARLHQLRIGVHVVGGGGDVPPALALARHGLLSNLHGYSIYGDYSNASPPSALIQAVAWGEIDLAVMWGPLAGYFVSRESRPLDMLPLPPRFDTAATPMTYAISMGVREEDTRLRALLDGVVRRRHEDIRSVLQRYGVPMVSESPMSASKLQRGKRDE
jgi:mxaJ protein